ncbi:MAG: hypothetical protein CMM87_04310, partial [Rickettsiales bacterium]|nr:hypothetical protein [Rickettsiales bacterium]
MTYNFVYLDSNNKLTNLNAFDFNINTLSVNNNATLQGPLQINNNINITENTNYNTFFSIKNKSNQSKFSINTNTGNTDIKGSLKVGDIMPQSGINLSNPNTSGNNIGSASQAFEHIYAKDITVSNNSLSIGQTTLSSDSGGTLKVSSSNSSNNIPLLESNGQFNPSQLPFTGLKFRDTFAPPTTNTSTQNRTQLETLINNLSNKTNGDYIVLSSNFTIALQTPTENTMFSSIGGKTFNSGDILIWVNNNTLVPVNFALPINYIKRQHITDGEITSSKLDSQITINSLTVASQSNFSKVIVTGDTTIGGNLKVEGSTNTVTTTNTAITDRIIELNKNHNGENLSDLGLLLNRGSSTNGNYFIGWNEDSDKFVLGNVISSANNKYNIQKGTLLANIESDTISVSKDLNIDGNINIKGNVANISTNNLVVEDSLIILANNNKNDSFFDIGLYAEYTDNSNKFTGFVRKNNTKKWTLFKDIAVAPNSTNITDNISVNQIDTLVANIEGNKLNISGNSSISENLNVLGNLTITNGLVVPYNNNYNNVKGSIYYDNTNNKFFGHYDDKGWKNLGGIDDTTDTSISQNLSVSRNLNVIGNITLNDTLFI